MNPAQQSYEPRPNSVPWLAIRHLRTLEPGAEISSAALAEAIDVDAKLLAGNLAAALSHGAVFMRRKGGMRGSPGFWSLTNHQARNGHAPAREHSVETPTQRVIAAADAPPPQTSAPRSVFEQAAAPPPATPKPAPAVCDASITEGNTMKRAMRIALWSDGALVIERADEVIRLQREEVRQLVDYLDAISLDIAREAG